MPTDSADSGRPKGELIPVAVGGGGFPVASPAEPAVGALMASGFVTRTSLHYVRNPAAVPPLEADWDTWRVDVCGLVRRPMRLSMQDLTAGFRPHEVAATMVAAGNRGKEMATVKPIAGVEWGPGAIATSVWRGARLCDVLRRCGVLPKRRGGLHVCFQGAGDDSYETGISVDVALDPASDVLLAYAQNGKPLLPDHGFPVRVIVPGCIGGRWIKCLRRILVSQSQATGLYHYHDNRLLPSNVLDAHQASSQGWWFKTAYVINELNVNSVITSPEHGDVLPINSQTLCNPSTICGYAYSGGGRQVVRVEITADGGGTWVECNVGDTEKATKYGKHWCWCFWDVHVDTAELLNAKEIAVRAWDSSMNTQPKELAWNVLGMMNNCWYRVRLSPFRSKECELGLRCDHPTQPGNVPGGWMGATAASPMPMTKSLSAPSMGMSSAAVEPERQVSMAEVRRHNTRECPWIVVHGRVYECTKFLKDHPGGPDSILLNAGSDCSDEFDAIHSDKAKSMLNDYLVASLLTGDDDDEYDSSATADDDNSGHDVGLKPGKTITCTLVSKTKLGHDTRLLRLTLPETDREKPVGLPVGKHVLLMADIDGVPCVRAYTPISDGQERGHLDLLIRVYERGLMSTYLDRNLPVGGTVKVKGPTGHIQYEGRGQLAVGTRRLHVRKMAMVAGGTGITPMFQLIRAVLGDSGDETQLFLVYANRNTQDILLRRELDELAARHSRRFRLWYVVSTEPAPENEDGGKWAFSVGRVDAGMLVEHLPAADAETVAFVCGPTGMVKETCIPCLTATLGYPLQSCLVF